MVGAWPVVGEVGVSMKFGEVGVSYRVVNIKPRRPGATPEFLLRQGRVARRRGKLGEAAARAPTCA